MQIFIHTTTGLVLESIEDKATVTDLITATGITDAAAWLEDAEAQLDATSLVAKAIGDKGHVHITRCRRIEVTINFNGKSKSRRFSPAATIARVRRWAVGDEGFDLPQKERPKHEVGVSGTGVIADRNDHVGTLAIDCELSLDLAPKDRFQG